MYNNHMTPKKEMDLKVFIFKGLLGVQYLFFILFFFIDSLLM